MNATIEISEYQLLRAVRNVRYEILEHVGGQDYIYFEILLTQEDLEDSCLGDLWGDDEVTQDGYSCIAIFNECGLDWDFKILLPNSIVVYTSMDSDLNVYEV